VCSALVLSLVRKKEARNLQSKPARV
jgi:hypothetical protein